MKDDIKKKRAASTRAGLTPEEEIEFGERIHDEKKHDKRDLSWDELMDLAEDIKAASRRRQEGEEV
jgi:hypothetical protein